jgi:SAM-dependent methyltransferase
MSWYAQWFQEDYEILYSHRNDEQAQHQWTSLCQHLKLDSSALCLDLGCGKGRHLLHAQKDFPNMIGLDLSPWLLKRAFGHHQKLVRSDFEHLPFQKNQLDAIFSFFTSFGYFEPREKNLEVLHQTLELVKDGGYFFLDLFNLQVVANNLSASDIQMRDDRKYTQERYQIGTQICKKITIEKPGQDTQLHFEKVYGFEQIEIEDIFKNSGFELHFIWGDEFGRPYEPKTSPRMSFLFQKMSRLVK